MNHFKVLNKYSIHDFLFAMHKTQIKLCVVLERKGHSRNAVLPTSMKRNLNWCKNVILQLYELGTPVCTIINDFLEKFLTAFDPPPPSPFLGKMLRFFSTEIFGTEMTPPN